MPCRPSRLARHTPCMPLSLLPLSLQLPRPHYNAPQRPLHFLPRESRNARPRLENSKGDGLASGLGFAVADRRRRGRHVHHDSLHNPCAPITADGPWTPGRQKSGDAELAR